MKKLAIFVIIYVLGGISGITYYHFTGGASYRTRIVALQNELNAKNDKLDKCTTALIEGMHPTPPAGATNPK